MNSCSRRPRSIYPETKLLDGARTNCRACYHEWENVARIAVVGVP